MKLMNKHEYWEAQETKPFLADVDRDGLIKSPEFIIKKYKSEVPLPLPEGYEWASIDMKDNNELE
jgi:hypothetical protein